MEYKIRITKIYNFFWCRICSLKACFIIKIIFPDLLAQNVFYLRVKTLKNLFQWTKYGTVQLNVFFFIGCIFYYIMCIYTDCTHKESKAFVYSVFSVSVNLSIICYGISWRFRQILFRYMFTFRLWLHFLCKSIVILLFVCVSQFSYTI